MQIIVYKYFFFVFIKIIVIDQNDKTEKKNLYYGW